jgi:autotransporter-associated beta strand protein
MNILRSLAVAAILAGSVYISSGQANGTWTAQGVGSTNLNWGNPDNWFGGYVPGFYDPVYFEDINFSGYTNVFGVPNNVVDQDLAVGTLYYTAWSFARPTTAFAGTNYHSHTTLIPAGKTLTVGGAFGSALTTFAVGDIPGQTAWVYNQYLHLYEMITGGGNLSIADTNGLVSIGGNNSQGYGAMLDLTGLNTFTASVDRLWVGVSRDNPNNLTVPVGKFWMAPTNSITTKPNGGAYPSLFLSHGGSSIGTGGANVILGRVNDIKSDAVVIGGLGANNAIVSFTNGAGLVQNSFAAYPFTDFVSPAEYLTNSGTFKLRGSDGISRTAILGISDSTANQDFFGPSISGNGLSCVGSLDLRNGVADVYVDRMYLGRIAHLGVTNSSVQISQGGWPNHLTFGQAQLMWENGTIDANTVNLGRYENYNFTGTIDQVVYASAQLTGNAVWNIQGDMVQCYRTNSSPLSAGTRARSVMWVNDNARVNIGGNLFFSDGSWNSPAMTNLNLLATNILSGGVINMVNHGVAQFNYLYGAGTVSNASQIQIGGAYTNGNRGTINPGQPTSAGSYSVGTLNLSSNLVFLTNSTITFDLGAVTNVGGVVNDFINVAGDLTGSSNLIAFNPYAGALQVGAYRLIDYSGSLNGNFSLTNRTRSNVALDTATPGRIRLLVNSWTPASLKWVGGGAGTNWDNSMALSWSNGPALDYFHMADSVVFDDSCTIPGVKVTDSVLQSGMLFTNSTKDIHLTDNSVAEQSIGGPGGLTKNAPGTLWLHAGSPQAAHTWFGPVNINGGFVRLASSSAYLFGQGTNPITVASGGAIQFNGGGIAGDGVNGGRPIVLAGSGPATFPFGALQAVSAGSSSYSRQWLLADNTTIGVTNLARTTLSGPSSFAWPPAGSLDMNGFNLTNGAIGTVANAGSVTLQALAVTNSSLANGRIILSNNSPLDIINCTVDGAGTIDIGSSMLVLGSQTSGSSSGSSAGYINKPISVANGVIGAPNGQTASTTFSYEIPVNNTISVAGTLTISNLQPIRVNGGIVESTAGSGLTKIQTAKLTLNGANTYTGPTMVQLGTLAIGSAGSIASPYLYFGAGTTFDTTAKAGTFTLASGQGLLLNGYSGPGNAPLTTNDGGLTVGSGSSLYGVGVINGNLILAQNGEIAPGDTNKLGQFLVNGNVALQGGHFTWEVAPSFVGSDGIVVNGDLDIRTAVGVSNVFTINSIGGFATNQIQTLITYTGSLLTNAAGALSSLRLDLGDLAFSMQLIDPSTTPGRIQALVTSLPGTLVWQGYGVAPTNQYWDIRTTANWTNVDSGIATGFGPAEYVVFDQTASVTTVLLTNASGLALAPGSVVVTNAAYTFQGLPGITTSSMLISNGAALTVANGTENKLLGDDGLSIDSGSTVNFIQPTNAVLYANLNGSGTLNKDATTNDLRIQGDATGFSFGSINVKTGILSAGSSNAIAGSVTVSPTAVFNINGWDVRGAYITAQGNGTNGLGAIDNTATVMGTNFPPYNSAVGGVHLDQRDSWISNCVENLTLSGDILLGASGSAWGIQGLIGNGFNLAKTGTNDIWIGTDADTGLNNIDVRQGRLVFARQFTGLGPDSGRVTVWNNATIAFAATNKVQTFGLSGYPTVVGPISKPIVVTNGTIELYHSAGGLSPTGTFTGPIFFTNGMTLRVQRDSYLNVWGNISNTYNTPLNPGTSGALNSRGMMAYDGGNIRLMGTNGYFTNTWIRSGTVTVSNQLAFPTNYMVIMSNSVPPQTELALELFLGTNGAFENRGIAMAAYDVSPVTLRGEGKINSPLFLFPGNANFSSRKAYYFEATGSGLDFAGTNNTFVGALSTCSGSYNWVGKLRFRYGLRLANPPLGTNINPATVYLNVNDVGGSPTITLDATNDWAAMQANAGQIIINTNDALPPGAPITSKTGDLTIDLNGYNQTLSSYKPYQPVGAFNIQWGAGAQATIRNNSTNSDSVFTFDGARTYLSTSSNNVSTNCWDLTLQDGPTHKVSLTVASGVLEILGNNAYSGPTLVTGGKLLLGNYPAAVPLNGVLPATTTLTVTNTGAFGGNGRVNCPVTISSGGTLIPGECLEFTGFTAPVGPATITRTGRLTFGGSSLTLNPGSTSIFNVNNAAGTNASVVGIGTVTYGGSLVVSNLSTMAYTNGQVIKLFDAATYTGTFSSIVTPGIQSYVNSLATNGTIIVTALANYTPIKLAAAKSGASLAFSWPADHLGWTLQCQTNALGIGIRNTNAWLTVPGTDSFTSTNIPVNPANPTMFFRLLCPP